MSQRILKQELSGEKRSLGKRRLDLEIKNCTLCPGLNWKGVTENAPAYGDINSSILIIGQSLCEPCMSSQIPFTGGSGEILDEVFRVLGIDKEQVLITNTVHCHPQGNRPSTRDEIHNCRNFLLREIKVSSARLIVCLGADATGAITGRKLVQLRNKPVWVRLRASGRRIKVCAFNHPAYLYRWTGRNWKGTDEGIEYINQLVEAMRPYI